MQACAVEVGVVFEVGDRGDSLDQLDHLSRLEQLPHGGVNWVVLRHGGNVVVGQFALDRVVVDLHRAESESSTQGEIRIKANVAYMPPLCNPLGRNRSIRYGEP